MTRGGGGEKGGVESVQSMVAHARGEQDGLNQRDS